MDKTGLRDLSRDQGSRCRIKLDWGKGVINPLVRKARTVNRRTFNYESVNPRLRYKSHKVADMYLARP